MKDNLLPHGSLPEDDGRPEDNELDLERDGDRILVAERDVIKCIVYFTEKDFEPPCDFDHPFAFWAAWLWMLKFTNDNIRHLYDRYIKAGDQGDEFMEGVRQQLVNALDEELEKRGQGGDAE